MSPTRLLKNKFLTAGLLIFFNLLLISVQVPLGSKTTLTGKSFIQVCWLQSRRRWSGSGRAIVGTWNNIRDLARVTRKNQELEREIFFLRQENRLLQEKLRLTLKRADLEESLKLVAETVRRHTRG